ncbi:MULTISPECIES: ABC transporter substrate-binding protein [unclassified Aeromicrobium]|uniref:ABC transporter substrate-binding protein n=1 Tax=unclassified Aeromicrobium TaxID=2633570 RepID=UPI00288ACE9B|nr:MULTISPECIES: ABC transporter substrate-binding protein [unclassified Aeromicrobium]
MKTRRLFAAVAAATALTTLLAACGGGGSDDSGDGPQEVKVGALPILDVAALHLGIQEGLFEDEGLELSVENAQGGAAIIPAVLQGDTPIGFSNVTSLLIARSKGLPVQIIAPASASTGEPGKDFAAVVVNEDSDIESAADLAGATVAINTLNNISDTVIRETVRKDGGDEDAVEFVEMAFPDMPAALEAGNVDAVFVVEPFLSITQKAGARPVAWPYAEAVENLEVAVFFTSEQTAKQEPELIEKFTRAMVASQELASSDEEKLRAIPTTYTEIDEALLADLTFPLFASEVSEASAKGLADLGQKDGLFDEAPDLRALFGS